MTLKKQIAQRKQRVEALRREERNPRTDARLSHEAGVGAEQLEREITHLEQQLDGNVEMVGLLDELIHFLEGSPHKSTHRTLALRHLEDAQSRLLRENGN